MESGKKYTISEVAAMMGVAPSTLRYYDKEGLLPFVERVNGRRVFTEADFPALRIIDCLKNTGMSIKDIRRYFELAKKGDETLDERLGLILAQKRKVEEQIAFLKDNLDELKYKENYYRTAIDAGTEDIHRGRSCSPSVSCQGKKEE